MKVLVVFGALVAVAAAQFFAPGFNAGLGYGGWGHAGLGYARTAMPYAAGHFGHMGYAGHHMGYAGHHMGYAGARWAAPRALPYAAPAVMAAPVAAPAAPISKYHAQDELGRYEFGYKEPLSAKKEMRGAMGETVGAYSYIDANGIKQTTTYVADALGFRAKATNLPVAPVAHLKAPVAPVANLVAPVMTLTQVEDTAEVKAAKAEFLAKFDEAAAAAAAAPDDEKKERRRRAAAVVPMDTPAVRAAKLQHAMMYNAAASAALTGAVPAPVVPLDTPAVMAAKHRHAVLWNRAAARAAAAPDYGPYNHWGNHWAGAAALPRANWGWNAAGWGGAPWGGWGRRFF